jgi:hypothetical protein
VRWVEVVEVEVAAVVELAVVADVGRAGWAVDRPPVPVATACVPIVATRSLTQLECPVTRRGAQSAARR